MMKKLTLLLFLAFSFVTVQNLEAKIRITYQTGPHFVKTHDLPEEVKEDLRHVNFGVAFEQFSIFSFPVWNYGVVQYALISNDEKDAWTLDEEQIEYFRTTYNLDIPAEPSIPLGQKVGLKPIILLVIIYFVWSAMSPKKEEEEEVAPEELEEEEEEEEEEEDDDDDDDEGETEAEEAEADDLIETSDDEPKEEKNED